MNLPPDKSPHLDPKALARRLEQLAKEEASVRWEDMPRSWWDDNAKGLSTEFGAWSSQISNLLRSHYQAPSPVFWAIANADRRVDDIFAEPRSSFERVKDLYLEAIRLALADLRENIPKAGESG